MTNIELKSPLPMLASTVKKTRPYVGVLIFLLFAGVYGYMVVKINALSDPAIDQGTVLTEVKSLPVPRIDSEAASRLLTLEDNSVSVKTLFEKSRTNPFSE